MYEAFSIAVSLSDIGTISVECPEGLESLNSIIFKHWRSKSWAVKLEEVRLKDHDLIKLAVKVLTSKQTEMLCGHVFVPDLHLLRGHPSWSSTVVDMRAKVLGYSGRYGEPHDPSACRRFVDRDGFREGTFSIDWDSATSEWVLRGRPSFYLLCEAMATYLRDDLVKQTDQRYYVPWLTSRPAKDWDGVTLRKGANAIKPVENWVMRDVAPENPPAQLRLGNKTVQISEDPIPEDLVIQFPVAAPPADSTVLNAVAVTILNTEDYVEVALHKREDGCFQLVKVLLDDGTQYWGNPNALVYFPSFADLVTFWSAVASSVEFQNDRIPSLQDPRNQTFGAWMPRVRSKATLVQRQAREKIAAYLLSKETQLSEDRRENLRKGAPDERRVGRIVVDSNPSDRSVFFTSSASRANPVMMRDEVLKLILLIMSDSEAKSSPSHHFPELAIALELWRAMEEEEGLTEPRVREHAVETPLVEAPIVAETVEESAPVTEEVVEIAVASATPSPTPEPVTVTLNPVLSTPYPVSLPIAAIPLEMTRRLDLGFAVILSRHSL